MDELAEHINLTNIAGYIYRLDITMIFLKWLNKKYLHSCICAGIFYYFIRIFSYYPSTLELVLTLRQISGNEQLLFLLRISMYLLHMDHRLN